MLWMQVMRRASDGRRLGALRPLAERVPGVVPSLLLAAAMLAPAHAADAPAAPGIYSCTDDQGRKRTSDRPIAECTAKEQRVLNRDGSLREVKPPTPTAEERAETEARERKANEARMAAAETLRRDRNLLARYRDEDTHRRARANALDTVKLAMKASEQRLTQLAAERKPLIDEAEFYKGKPLPPKLKSAIDANDAALDAQRSSIVNQEAEVVRVNRLYDIELERLRKLWAGARPGSLGPLRGPQSDAVVASTVATSAVAPTVTAAAATAAPSPVKR